MSQRPEQLPRRSSNIFINYRREDSSGHAGRLFDRLSGRFPERVFMDIDKIAPGIDFVETIEQAVGCCEVLVVMIGRDWLFLTDSTGRRRLDNPNDFVRLEIASALERNIRVIPVLVEGASMPRPEDLSPDLVRLTRRNAIELSDGRWAFDVDRLIQTIEGVLQERAPSALLPVVKAPAVPAHSEPAPAARQTRPRVRTALAVLALLAVPGWMGWNLVKGTDTEKVAIPNPAVPQAAPVSAAPQGEPAAADEKKVAHEGKISPPQQSRSKKKGWLRSVVQRGKSALRNARGHGKSGEKQGHGQ